MKVKNLLMVSLLLAASTARAADQPRTASLTSEEIAKGWIMLFDGETLFGWNKVGEGDWTIAEGMLAPQKDNKSFLVTTTGFMNFNVVFEYRLAKGSTAQILLGCDKDGQQTDAALRKPLWGQPSSDWITGHVTVKDGTLESIHFEQGNTGSARPTNDGPKLKSGYFALAGNNFVLRSIKLLPTKAKRIFNGKDLSGWKEIQGKKSKCSVNKDGLLEIKDGPGDIQTEGQWSDFVLQLDCRCNGDNNNSGVFFRALPGQFWQGYESQIYNRNDETKPQEYTLQDFDSKTHEPKGTRKVKYAAQDYGTGGIYNRQPVRKQAAKDHEWFAMTVVAQGRHIGVWVNGYMVTDWTDNRPIKESARDGCRLEKGCISLQGHDPTTDLNFRNIRISELPADSEK
jgi:hypothetical protein